MPVPEARVHEDEDAQAGAAGIGARAFAHGTDIFLGPGESAQDPALMAHELTHVAQQAGATPDVQGKVEVGAPGTPAEQEADAVAAVVTGRAAEPALLVDGDAPLASGQMRKADFIAMLGPQLTTAASEELGPLWSTAGCPYIAKYLAAYAGRSARDAEAFVRRFTHSKATTAAALIPDMIARVRVGVRAWRDTGQVPPEVAAADPAAAQAASAAAEGGPAAQLMPREGGHAIDASVAAAASETMRVDLASVRVHTGPAANRLARDQGGVAVAAGRDVAFAAGAYQPGTPQGDALIAHELAHVAQQDGANHVQSGDSESADEADADGAAVGVVQQLWSGLQGRSSDKVSPGRKSGLALRRCDAPDTTPPKAMDKARYTAIETKLKDLIAKKQGVVESGAGDMAAIDAEIDRLIAELRIDFGVRLEKGKILDAASTGKDPLVVDGRIVLSPSDSQHYMGERLGFKLEVDHVPPGENLQIAWRWRTAGAGDGSRFLITGPAFAEKTKSQEMDLDTPFWGLVPDAVEKAQGMEVLAHIYIGDVDKPTKTFSTGFVPMPRRPVGDIKVIGAPNRVVADQYLDLGIGPWTPDFSGHSIDWFVDDVKAAEDQLGLRRQFGVVGKHLVRADVHTVRRSFGIHDKKLLKSADTSFEVLTADKFGTAFLDELDASPFRPKPVGVDKLVSSGDASVAEIQHRIDQGGSQQAYWQERMKAQKERLKKIKELAPDYATAKPLPADPSKLEPGSYSGPITAALVMAQSGGAQPLTVNLTIQGKDGAWTTRIIDSTSRKVLKYDGSGKTPLDAYNSVFDDWKADNEYPTGGRIVHRFAPSGWAKGNGFDTYTTWKRAKEWVDGIITVGGFIIGALLLADPDPTISKLLGAILMAAVIARSSVAIYERINNGGDILSSENILDGVAIVTAFLGMGGGVLRSAGLKAINPTVYRAGNWMVMGALAGDAGTLVYVSAEALAQLKVIQGDPTMDDGQKASEILRIMASLFVTGAMLIVSNKELLRGGLKPTDFVESKLKPGTKPELDVGARLDAEYELKQAGKWSKETAKLTDEALLDQVFTNRSRQELEGALAAKVGQKPAAALADALGNDAFVKLHQQLGEEHMAALAKDVGAAKAGDIHGQIGTDDLGALVKHLGVPRFKALVDGMGGAQVKDLVDKLGRKALEKLAGELSGKEIAGLVKDHGATAVKWAGESLAGNDSKALLGALRPNAAIGLQDVTAAEAKQLVAVFGVDTVNGVIPPVTGKQLTVERAQLGDKTARGLAEEKLKHGKAGDLATHADQMGAVAAKPLAALGNDSIVADSNVLAGIKEMMDGLAWSKLQPHKQSGINYLRSRAKPPVPPLTGDPPARDAESIIGKGHDLRAANVTRGESAPHAGLDQDGFGLTISRDSPQYASVLDELAKEPVVGGKKGAGDRAIVADAMFADGLATPTMMSGDADVVTRLFSRYGPGKSTPIKQKPGQSVMAAIAEKYPAGFDVAIPDGASGARTITIVPMK